MKRILSSLFLCFFLVQSQGASAYDPEQPPQAQQSHWGYLLGHSFDAWFNENLNDAINIALTSGPKQIAPRLLDKNITGVVQRLVLRVLGIHNNNHASIIFWLIGQGKGGLYFYSGVHKNMKNWLPVFLVNIVGPAFIKRAVTGLIYKSITNGIGLEFPSWVKAWPFLYSFLGMNLHSFAHMGLDTLYNQGLELGKKLL